MKTKRIVRQHLSKSHHGVVSFSKLKARGTPRQWAYANQLANEAGWVGIGEFIQKRHPDKKSAPKSFQAGIRQMTPLVSELKRIVGTPHKKGR